MCRRLAKCQQINKFFRVREKGDYHKMEFPDDTFDGLYALESTCYARKPVDVYKEVVYIRDSYNYIYISVHYVASHGLLLHT